MDLAKLLVDAGTFDENALSDVATYQRPLSFELAMLLVGAEAFHKRALSSVAEFQSPLPLELAKLLVDAGCDPAAQDSSGWDALVGLTCDDHPVDPRVTDLFLSAGCRTDLDGCGHISGEHHTRFDRILKEHAEWAEERSRLATETLRLDSFYALDWSA